MTSLPLLYERLYRAESDREDLRNKDYRYYSRDQIRAFNKRKKYLGKRIKELKKEISIHPNAKSQPPPLPSPGT